MKKVKVDTLIKATHQSTNKAVINTAEELSEAFMVSKLDDCLKMRGLSQKDFSLMTGIRIGTVSDMVNGKGVSFNKVRIMATMSALRITDISDLFDIYIPEETKAKFDREREEWLATRSMPESVYSMYSDNLYINQLDKKK